MFGIPLPRAVEGYEWRKAAERTAQDPLAFLQPQRMPVRYASDPGDWLIARSRLSAPVDLLSIKQREAVLGDFGRLGELDLTPSDELHTAILDFAARWGSLSGGPEPLAWWMAEIRAMAGLLDLREDVNRLRYPGLYSQAEWSEARRRLWEIGDEFFDDPNFYKQHPQPESERVREAIVVCHRQLAREVSQALREYTQVVLRPLFGKNRAPAGAELLYVPANLLGAIYLSLAFELAGVVGKKQRCPNPLCPNGGTFYKRRPNQKACNEACQKQAWRASNPRRKQHGEA